MSLKICIVSDAIERPFDEGVKIFVYNIIKELSKDNEVLALSHSEDVEEDIQAYCKKAIPENKMFISIKMIGEIRKFDPNIIYYIPVACATIYSFFRAKILQKYGMNAKTIMITLQPRSYSFIKEKLIQFLSPDLVLAQSMDTQQTLTALGCRSNTISVGVDLKKFLPAQKERKPKLREKYGFPADKYLIFHVGHINMNRNVQFFKKIQGLDNIQTVVVGSASTPQDRILTQQLKEKGVIVIDQTIEKIEEIYQCVDCYLFPVLSEGACIEIPLSVFEAMAANLPVVTTRFGGLPNLVDEQDGFFYADSQDDIITKIVAARKIDDAQTRKLAERFSWENVARQILELSEP